MKRFSILIAIIFCSYTVTAADGDLLWGNRYNPNAVEVFSTGAKQNDTVRIADDGNGGCFIFSYQCGSVQYIDSQHNFLWGQGIKLSPIPSAYGGGIDRDGSGGAVVCWIAHNAGGNYCIFVQRFKKNGNAVWSAPVAVSQGSTSSNEWPVMVGDNSGGAYIAYQAPGYKIEGVHVDENGQFKTVTLGLGGGVSGPPNIVCDNIGGAIVVWGHSGQGGIWAQRMERGCSLPWCTTGAMLVSNSGIKPHVSSDGKKGAFVGFFDSLAVPGVATEIRVQRLGPDGACLWGTNGAVVINSSTVGGLYHLWSNSSGDVVVTNDGCDGAIVGWTDYRNYSKVCNPPYLCGQDVYAQRLDKNGNGRWTPNGVLVSWFQAGTQEMTGIVSDGSEGAIIVYSDLWGWDYPDISVAAINKSGAIVWNKYVYTDSTSAQQPGITQTGEQIVFDGSGNPRGPLVAWCDKNGVYMEKISYKNDKTFFRRGDIEGNGAISISDPINILYYLFKGGDILCPDAADTNDDGNINLADAIYLLNYLFNNGSPPGAPGAIICGDDPTADNLPVCLYCNC